jgi:hypothetical protein
MTATIDTLLYDLGRQDGDNVIYSTAEWQTLAKAADAMVEEAKELRELVKEASKEWTKSVEFSDWPEAQDWVLRAEAATQAEQGE